MVTVNLFNQLDNQVTGGTWTTAATTGSPPLPPNPPVTYNGDVDFSGVSVGSYVYSYQPPGICKPTQSTVSVNVEEDCSTFSANNYSFNLCQGNLTALNINDSEIICKINGIDISSGDTISLSGVDLELQTPTLLVADPITGGTYSFNYNICSAASGCTDTGVVNLTVIDVTGLSSIILVSACTNSGTIDLFDLANLVYIKSLLSNSWALFSGSPISGTFNGSAGVFSTNGNIGDYSFTFDECISCGCIDVDVTVTVVEEPDVGSGTTISVCQGVTVTMFDDFNTENGGTVVSGGTFTALTSCLPVPGGSFNGITFDTTGVTLGLYCFTYTVIHPICGTNSSSFSINVISCP